MSAWRIGFGEPGSGIVVEVGVPEAVPVIGFLFPDDRFEPGSRTCDVFVRTSTDGFEVVVRDSGTWSSTELPGVLARVELIVAEHLVRASARTGVHAAAGVPAAFGKAILLTGPGGAGKSTFTAGMAMRGVPVLGDDVVLLEKGRVHPFRRLLKVEEPARTLLGLPEPRAQLSRAWPEASFYHPVELGSRWAQPAEIGALVVLDRRTSGPVALAERRPTEVLPTLLAGLVLVARVEPNAFGEVVDALYGARCFELSYAESPPAIEALLSELS